MTTASRSYLDSRIRKLLDSTRLSELTDDEVAAIIVALESARARRRSPQTACSTRPALRLIDLRPPTRKPMEVPSDQEI